MQGGGTIVRCYPAIVTGIIGETLTVDLYVQDVTALYGIDLRTNFDPTIAQVVDEDTGPDAGRAIPAGEQLLAAKLSRAQRGRQHPGHDSYAAAQTNPTAPATGFRACGTHPFHGPQGRYVSHGVYLP